MRADFDLTLAQYLLEEGVLPVSFRSGWHFMDQDWQQYLNQLIPFCFHDNYPTKVSWYTNSTGPIAGIEDWSRAPSTFVPFRPATNDYQLAGDGPCWNVRSVKMQSLTQAVVDQMFAEASNGTDQFACFWDHLPENFVANVARLGSLLGQASSNYPNVRFRYCTAVEAMQRWLGLTNQVPPQLGIIQNLQDPTLSLLITSSVPIFQKRPFVCVRDVLRQYMNLTSLCVPAGKNTWTIDLGLPTNFLAKVAVAVTDIAGNLATQTLRFVPDDLYLDNRDAEYVEEQGSWTSTTNAAWGTDARLMLLNSNTTARASWYLPLSSSGRYRVDAQVPGLPNAATNVVFHITAADTNVLSVSLPSGLATNQWTFIGSVLLDQALSNRVEMVVNGSGQPETYAIADALRIVPAPDAGLPDVTAQQPVKIFSTYGGWLLRFGAQAGSDYAVERGSSLMDVWSILQVATPSNSGILEYEDEKPPPGQAFYRIVAR